MFFTRIRMLPRDPLRSADEATLNQTLNHDHLELASKTTCNMKIVSAHVVYIYIHIEFYI